MKTIKKSIIAISLLLGLNACNVLDFSPTDRYNEMTVWASKTNIESYINSFYETAQVYGEFGEKSFATKGFCTDGLTWMLKYSSDVAGYGTPNLVLFIENQISSSQNALSYWTDCYSRIRKINEFLDGIDKYCDVLTEDEKNAYKAEAHLFRGYLYFLLVRAHHSVILYDGLADWEHPQKARSSEEECWEFVKQELDYAYTYLPNAKSTNGRVDKATAAALKSRAMLFAERWDEVIDAAKKVIDIGYDLDPSYANVFKSNAQNRSVESIFQVDYIDESYNHTYDSKYAPSGDDENAMRYCAAPTQEMVSHYEKTDGTYVNWDNLPQNADLTSVYQSLEPRFQASILYNGAHWKGRTIETFVGGKDGYAKYGETGVPKTTVTGYYMRKMLDESNTTITTTKSFQSFVAIRYAEVLLNYAEALIQSDTQKNISLAMSLINKIRQRVSLPDVNASTADAAMKCLMHEREIELAFEGFHYWDLKRWKKAKELLNGLECHGIKITKSVSGFSYEIESCDAGQKRIFPEKYYSLPIPDNELTNNPLCTQLDAWK